jgi:hypothetical protein
MTENRYQAPECCSEVAGGPRFTLLGFGPGAVPEVETGPSFEDWFAGARMWTREVLDIASSAFTPVDFWGKAHMDRFTELYFRVLGALALGFGGYVVGRYLLLPLFG